MPVLTLCSFLVLNAGERVFAKNYYHHLSLVSPKTTVIHGMVKLNTLFGNRLKCLTFHTFLKQKIIDTAFPLVFKVTRFIFHKKYTSCTEEV